MKKSESGQESMEKENNVHTQGHLCVHSMDMAMLGALS